LGPAQSGLEDASKWNARRLRPFVVSAFLCPQAGAVKQHLLGFVLPRNRGKGFSLVEMVVSLAVLLILSAIAIPTLMRSYRSYLLGDAAARVAGIMKFTRFEAIRKNTKISCQVKLVGTNWILWTDTNGNGNPDSTEAQVVITGIVNLIPSGSVPSSAPIVAALGSASPGLSTLSGSNNFVTYDQRGAVNFGANSPAVYVFFLGNATIPDLGARAVVLLPSGIVQTWTVGAGNSWTRVN
jgi:prepilin-type N-terminal cleavage/methylation domain-containing protein